MILYILKISLKRSRIQYHIIPFLPISMCTNVSRSETFFVEMLQIFF